MSIHDRVEKIVERLPCATITRNTINEAVRGQRDKGLAKYGESLTENSSNLDSAQDCLEELVDALCYLLQTKDRLQLLCTKSFATRDKLLACRVVAALAVSTVDDLLNKVYYADDPNN